MHQCAKVRCNRLNCGRDIVIQQHSSASFSKFGGFSLLIFVRGTFRKSAQQCFFSRVKPRHVEKFRKCRFAEVGKSDSGKKDRSLKIYKNGHLGRLGVTQGHWQCHHYQTTPDFQQSLTAMIGLSCTVTEIQRDIMSEIAKFSHPLHKLPRRSPSLFNRPLPNLVNMQANNH